MAKRSDNANKATCHYKIAIYYKTHNETQEKIQPLSIDQNRTTETQSIVLSSITIETSQKVMIRTEVKERGKQLENDYSTFINHRTKSSTNAP